MDHVQSSLTGSAVRPEVTADRSGGGAELSLLKRVEGVYQQGLGAWGWLQRHVVAVSEWRICRPAKRGARWLCQPVLRVCQCFGLAECCCCCLSMQPRLLKFDAAAAWRDHAVQNGGGGSSQLHMRGQWLHDAMRRRGLRHGDVIAINAIPCSGWFIAYQASEVDGHLDFFQNVDEPFCLRVPLEVTARLPSIVQDYKEMFEAEDPDVFPRAERIQMVMFADHPYIRQQYGDVRRGDPSRFDAAGPSGSGGAAYRASYAAAPSYFIVELVCTSQKGPYRISSRPASFQDRPTSRNR